MPFGGEYGWEMQEAIKSLTESYESPMPFGGEYGWELTAPNKGGSITEGHQCLSAGSTVGSNCI